VEVPVQDRTGELGDQLATVIDGDDLYDTAAGIRTLRENAGNVQTAADDLLLDVRRFEAWMEDPTVRHDDLAEDAELLADAVDDLAAALDRPRADDPETRARRRAETAMRHRTLDLMLSDLRWELDAIRRVDERQGVEDEQNDVEGRIRGISERLSTVDDRLADVDTSDGSAHHEEQVLALDDALAATDHPVAWDTVQRVFEQHRAAL
jgi:hypothetical protein